MADDRRLPSHRDPPAGRRSALVLEAAWQYVGSWLAMGQVWVPPATERTALVLGGLLATTPVTANLMPDAQLAALAVEHGLTVFSADTDFARFPEVRWENPLRGD